MRPGAIVCMQVFQNKNIKHWLRKERYIKIFILVIDCFSLEPGSKGSLTKRGAEPQGSHPPRAQLWKATTASDKCTTHRAIVPLWSVHLTTKGITSNCQWKWKEAGRPSICGLFKIHRSRVMQNGPWIINPLPFLPLSCETVINNSNLFGKMGFENEDDDGKMIQMRLFLQNSCPECDPVTVDDSHFYYL